MYHGVLFDLILDESIRAYARKLTFGSELWEDLLHHSTLILYDQGEEKISHINSEGKLRHYLVVVLHHEWRNPNNSFNKLYRHLSGDVEYRDMEIPDDSGGFSKPSKEQVKTCERYFSKVTPDNILISDELERMKNHDREHHPSGYYYRTALMELYLKHGSYNKVAKETGISKPYIIKHIKEIKDEIRENTTNHKPGHGA